MGYTTDFGGELTLSRPAKKKELEYINALAGTRRMKRDAAKLMEKYKGKHGNPYAKEKTAEAIYGRDGEYFAFDNPSAEGGIFGGNFRGQGEDGTIIDYNTPPGQVPYGDRTFTDVYAENQRREKEGTCQPGLWCQWILSEDGTELRWDEGEKFYNYVEWLKYLIEHFFSKWKIKLNGEIFWHGEHSEDRGLIIVKNNVVKIKYGRTVYEDAE